MKDADFAKMTVPQLVERFTQIAIKQFQAELRGETTQYNRLYDEIVTIKQELKRRAGDQRRALVPLFAHPNAQVRLMAAQWALAVAPRAARQTLQEIWDRNEFPQAAHACQTLMALDEGTSQLT